MSEVCLVLEGGPEELFILALPLAILGYVTIILIPALILYVRRRMRPRPSPMSEAMRRYYEREKAELDMKKKEGIKNEREDKRAAASAANELLDIYGEIGTQYSRDTPLPDMGSRLHKYWYRVTSQETYNCHILTVGNVSPNFECDHHVESYLNRTFSSLDHPYLQAINDIKFVSKHGRDQVAIIQPYWEMGSLKDLIYKTTPSKDWSQKYNRTSESLPPERVSIYGEQILEGVVYLYGRGFSPLGHIQTGNIYVEGAETCHLGGFENTLLKYKPRLHKTCLQQNCLKDIDVIMFGHVIYEMSAGLECPHLMPSEEDYEHVDEESCREVLRYIFKRKEGRFVRDMKMIKNHFFFGGSETQDNKEEVEGSKKLSLFQKARNSITNMNKRKKKDI